MAKKATDFDFEAAKQTYPWVAGLNPQQAEAVTTVHGPVLMLAGAGTGKTSALTTRIAHLLLTGTCHPQELLAVTFTNRAAMEMRQRVERLIGQPTEGWWLGTFHSLAARILRYNAEMVDLKSNFTILDDDDQARLCKQLIQVEGLDVKKHKPRDLVNLISRWKDRGLTPDRVNASEGKQFGNGKGLDLYKAYQERLIALNAVDFGDILLHNLTIFQNNKDILRTYQNRFKYLLVDEYQDTNVAQYLWLRLLAQEHKNICCVGDDDQSIYGWRGAEVGNILRFETDFPDAKVIRLEQNYRSSGSILKAASGLIRNNRERLGKTLWTADDEGVRPKLLSCWDGSDEARRISEEIEQLHRSGTKLKDIAVLVRASHVMRLFEERFNTTGIAYRVVGGPRFYERAEIRDALAYLRLIQSPDDDLAMERIINTPKRGIGNTSVQKLYVAARGSQKSLYRTAHLLVTTDDLPTAARKNIGKFLVDLDRWRDQAQSLPHTVLAELILDESGYTAMWQAEKTADAAGRLENLKELINAMSEFESLAGFLEHVSLVLETLSANDMDMVTLMTLHSAKGLEFDTVFLPAWEEGLFPSQRSIDQNGLKGLEEERRLAYVGITRARKKLYLSYAGSRQIHGQFSNTMPSRFIRELPEELIDSDTSGGSMGMRDYAQTWRGSSPILFEPNSTNETAFKNMETPGWRRAKRAFSENRQGGSGPAEGDVAEGKSFDVGERVFHMKFGYGHVNFMEDARVSVTFDHAGDKKLVSSFLKRASEVD